MNSSRKSGSGEKLIGLGTNSESGVTGSLSSESGLCGLGRSFGKTGTWRHFDCQYEYSVEEYHTLDSYFPLFTPAFKARAMLAHMLYSLLFSI